jgi:tripartite-type tricarboxylate transporter receptor subunit TctC
MKRESRLGRVLWVILLVLLGGYVVADFVRSPFSAPRGSAAVRPAAVTIWTPAADAGDESGAVLHGAAAGLELGGHDSVVKSIPGGSAQALIDFLSHHRSGHGALLAISSNTLADLAHDRRETLVPGAAEEAALARALLRRAKPVGILASAPLQLAVGSGSPIQSGKELVADLIAAPGDQLVGIEDDTFSRDQLAALVEGAGIDGEVRFTVFQSSAGAGAAIESGAAQTVLAGRPALRADLHHGRLRGFHWPLPGPAPRAWVAVVARPDTGAAELRRLRQWIAALQVEPHWRAILRRQGRRPGEPGTGELADLIRHTAPADRLEEIAQRVEAR